MKRITDHRTRLLDPCSCTQKNIPWYRQGKNSLSKIPFISRDSFPLCSREISFSSKGIDPYVWMVGNFCFFVAGKSLFKGAIPLTIPYLTGKLLVGISSPWNRIPLAAGNLHWGQKWRNVPLFITSKQGNIFLSVLRTCTQPTNQCTFSRWAVQ